MHGPPPTIPGLKCEPDMARSFRQEVAGLVGRGNNMGFPGAQPISFERSHLEALCSQEYVSSRPCYLCLPSCKANIFPQLLSVRKDGWHTVSTLLH
jgi:hypothetical protein